MTGPGPRVAASGPHVAASGPRVAAITGGAGAIGASIAEALATAGHRIIILDRAGDPPVDLADERQVRTAAQRVLDQAGVPCGPVYTYAELFADPQVVHRELVVHADDAELGRVPHIRTPVRLSGSAVGVRAVAPKLGEHTGTVLAGLGYGEADIAALRGAGVV